MSEFQEFIELKEVYTHNLKGISVRIPLKALTVVIGPSGSGKSSLVYATLAQLAWYKLRCLQSLASELSVEPTFQAQLAGYLPYVLAFPQGVRDWYPYKNLSEILGLQGIFNQLFKREGEYFCPRCGTYNRNATLKEVLSELENFPLGERFYFLLPLKKTSFEILRYLYAQGFGRYLVDEEEWLVDEKGFPQGKEVFLVLDRLSKKEGILGRLLENIRLTKELNGGIFFFQTLTGKVYSFNLSSNCVECGEGLITYFKKCPDCKGRGYQAGEPCAICHGLKLDPVVLKSKLFGLTIEEVLTQPLKTFLFTFNPLLQQRFAKLALDDLSLGTPVFKLSLGEKKALELLSLFASEMRDLLLVLDEPTLGLDWRRRKALLDQVRELVQRGNTLVVVEHDPLFIRSADYVIELGFKEEESGYLIFQGSIDDFLKAKTPTSEILTGMRKLTPPYPKLSNQQKISVSYLGREVSLIYPGLNIIWDEWISGEHNFLFFLARALIDRGYKVYSFEDLSFPKTSDFLVSYLKIWDALRENLILLPESRAKGLSKGHFSFHTKEGICNSCEGRGYKTFSLGEGVTEKTLCEDCLGKRLNREVLYLTYKGYKVLEILDFRLKDLGEFMGRVPQVQKICDQAELLGISYLCLSQPISELSGGERFRVELLRKLVKHRREDFYLFSFPLQGLHFLDLEPFLKFWENFATERRVGVVLYDCHPLLFSISSERNFQTLEEGLNILMNYYNLFSET